MSDTTTRTITPLYGTLYDEYHEKYRLLVNTFRENIHEMQDANIHFKITNILNLIYYKNDDNLRFVTVRPSPEYIYTIFNRVPSYQEQLEWFQRNILVDEIQAVSIEKGTKNTQLLHYHIIIDMNKRQYNKWYKKTVNCTTVLHKMYGYQKSVLESGKHHKLIDGIKYFCGISKNTTKLKPDIYKLYINNKYFYQKENLNKNI